MGGVANKVFFNLSPVRGKTPVYAARKKKPLSEMFMQRGGEKKNKGRVSTKNPEKKNKEVLSTRCGGLGRSQIRLKSNFRVTRHGEKMGTAGSPVSQNRTVKGKSSTN